MTHIFVTSPFGRAERLRLEAAARGHASIVFAGDGVDTALEFSRAGIIIGEPDIDDIKDSGSLRWIQMTWAGTDKYTSRPGFPPNVALTSASGAFGGIISEYVIGGILALYRRFPAYLENKRRHVWADAGSEGSLYGKTVLVLGTGDLGSCVAERCSAFGARPIGFRRRAKSALPPFESFHALTELESFLPIADIVVGCLPDGPSTRGIIGERQLLMMKRSALIVNVGRGTLIDLNALASALLRGRLAGAVLDVTSPEPLPEKHPLWDIDNVIITPHVAGPSFNHCPDTQSRIADICCRNLEHCFSGQTLENMVLPGLYDV